MKVSDSTSTVISVECVDAESRVAAIQFITSVERAKAEIPLMLAGREPPKDPDNVGSHDFSKPPEAVLSGRGFGAQQMQTIREACGGADAGLVWVNSVEKSRANIASSPPDFSKAEVVEKYSDQVAASIKKVLAEVRQKGKWGVDGVYEYE